MTLESRLGQNSGRRRGCQSTEHKANPVLCTKCNYRTCLFFFVKCLVEICSTLLISLVLKVTKTR